MKLYTKGQLGSVALVAVALSSLATGLIAWFVVSSGSAAAKEAPVAAMRADERLVSTEISDLGTEVASGVSEFSQDERENIDVYERLNSGVVNITTEVMAINWFMEPVPQEGASGSGSIIDPRGYVLTNVHVVKDAFKVYVNLADGDRYEGKVIGTDPENDIAVIKFDPPAGKSLTVIPFGSSSSLRVGQKVLAIGNPFGLERTLTRGIISSLGRPVQKDDGFVIRGMIQTDASINPGNSGGPLLNPKGEMIGINTMIYSPSGGSVGVGFAVPIDTARRVVPELIQYGVVKRGWIEFQPVQLFPDLVAYMRQEGYAVPVERGVLVSQAARGGNADKAGLRGGTQVVRYGRSTFYVGGDIVVSIDGFPVESLADVYSALEDNKPGDVVVVEYYRNGAKLQVKVTLADRAAVRK